MTFEEYALKNLNEMKAREPTAQNMRDVALLELWTNLKTKNNETVMNVSDAEIKKETHDILPAYFRYVNVKRKYQLKEVTQEKVIDTLKVLIDELNDLINLLYRNTDTNEERTLLNQMLQKNKYN